MSFGAKGCPMSTLWMLLVHRERERKKNQKNICKKNKMEPTNPNANTFKKLHMSK